MMPIAEKMPPNTSANWREIRFSSIEHWHKTDHAKAFAAFQRCAAHALQKPYRETSFGVSHEHWLPVYEAAQTLNSPNKDVARAFFETHFSFFEGEGAGFVTGFYEPEVKASETWSDAFSVPMLARPKDLIKIDPEKTYDGIPLGTRFARQNSDGSIESFDDRQNIEKTCRNGQPPSEPIAFLESEVDAFFIHVQGAGKCVFPNGDIKRISFDGKSGHDFTGPGRILAELGEIPLEDVTMQSIRAWFDKNPDRIDEILWRNRSYIFFKEIPVGDKDLGPIAAAKVQMEPQHALAVDRNIHRFGTPFFVTSKSIDFAELMIAQDTGSAIQGPMRGDIFMGCGRVAGERAGVIKDAASFIILLPKTLLPKKMEEPSVST